MDKFCVSVGIGMLVVPFLISGLVLLIASLIGLGVIALVGLCVIAYVGTALFLILKGCTSKE